MPMRNRVTSLRSFWSMSNGFLCPIAMAAAVSHDIESLDEVIARATEHWRLERIGLAERLVLRIAAWELRAGVTPPRVAIDQALWLARRFAGSAAIPFVNGVLDRVARDLGRL